MDEKIGKSAMKKPPRRIADLYKKVKNMTNEQLLAVKDIPDTEKVKSQLMRTEISFRIEEGTLKKPSTKCFSCKKTLYLDECSMGEEPHEINAVYGGLRFRATGNYGSTIFDPIGDFDEGFLEIIICDKCIAKKKINVQHIYDIKRTETSKTKQFESEEE